MKKWKKMELDDIGWRYWLKMLFPMSVFGLITYLLGLLHLSHEEALEQTLSGTLIFYVGVNLLFMPAVIRRYRKNRADEKRS